MKEEFLHNCLLFSTSSLSHVCRLVFNYFPLFKDPKVGHGRDYYEVGLGLIGQIGMLILNPLMGPFVSMELNSLQIMIKWVSKKEY